MSRADLRLAIRQTQKKGDIQRRCHHVLRTHDGMLGKGKKLEGNYRLVYGKSLFGGSSGCRRANGLKAPKRKTKAEKKKALQVRLDKKVQS